MAPRVVDTNDCKFFQLCTEVKNSLSLPSLCLFLFLCSRMVMLMIKMTLKAAIINERHHQSDSHHKYE